MKGYKEINRKEKGDKLIVTYKKKQKKDLQYYIDKCKGSKVKQEVYSNKSWPHITFKQYFIDDLSFEDCCGIMKLICDDLNKKDNHGYKSFIIDYNGEEFCCYNYQDITSPFRFINYETAYKAIEICGDKFLKKLYRIEE